MPDPTRAEMVEAVRLHVQATEITVNLNERRSTIHIGASAHLAALRAVLRELEAGGWRQVSAEIPPIGRDAALTQKE